MLQHSQSEQSFQYYGLTSGIGFPRSEDRPRQPGTEAAAHYTEPIKDPSSSPRENGVASPTVSYMTSWGQIGGAEILESVKGGVEGLVIVDLT